MALEMLARFLEEAEQRPDWNRVLRASWGAGPADHGHGHVVPEFHPALTVDRLLHIYRTMIASRRIDDRELMLQRQGKSWFTISAAGKEAVLAAAGAALRPLDPIWGYYRDRTITLMRGVTAKEMLMQTVAAAADPASGGRQMPEHYSDPDKAVITGLSPVAANCIPSVGIAEALAHTRELIGEGRYPADGVVYVALGESSTAEGEFYECVRAAITSRAPVLIHVLDDGFGISVPVSESMPGGDVMALFRGWPNLQIIENDGNDVRASYDSFLRGAAECRAGRGPVMIRSRVLRLYSHSSTDDMKKYRERSEIEIDFRERDPIIRYAQELLSYNIASARDLREINDEVNREILQATDEVLQLPKTDVSTLTDNVYNPDLDEGKADYVEAYGEGKPEAVGRQVDMATAINACLAELMDRNPGIVMWGEDIADLSREDFELHPELEGKGGVFGVTKGLQRRFGPKRVSNAPIAEATIIGRAAGWSIQGFLPIVEVEFRDYLSPGWQQLVDNVATLRWRSNGTFTCPMVIRMAYGGYLGGAGALWHSESANGALLHYPGIRICVPSNPEDAVGLLRAAAFCGDPVIYNEPKARYRLRDPFTDRTYPDSDFVLWPGSSRRYGDGSDLAILTYGTTTPICSRAMEVLRAAESIDASLLDLCWLNPLDEESIRALAEECGRVLIVEEDRRMCGAGTAIADVIYRDPALRRKVDVERVAALNTRVCYGPVGERAVLPQLDDILRAARGMFR